MSLFSPPSLRSDRASLRPCVPASLRPCVRMMRHCACLTIVTMLLLGKVVTSSLYCQRITLTLKTILLRTPNYSHASMIPLLRMSHHRLSFLTSSSILDFLLPLLLLCFSLLSLSSHHTKHSSSQQHRGGSHNSSNNNNYGHTKRPRIRDHSKRSKPETEPGNNTRTSITGVSTLRLMHEQRGGQDGGGQMVPAMRLT